MPDRRTASPSIPTRAGHRPTTAPKDAQPPALGALGASQVPSLPGSTSTLPDRPPNTPYSELDKVSTLILVAAVGVAEASRVLGIPPRTIYEWTADIGGVAGLRDRVREALGVTQYALALRVCDEVARRLGEFTPGELLDALRALAVGAVNPVAEAEHRDATTSPVSVTVQLVSPGGDPSGGSRTDTVPLDTVTAPPAQHLIEGQLAEKPADG